MSLVCRGADVLNWRAAENRVSADLRSTGLYEVLEQIAAATHWHVYVEPGIGRKVSVKFSDLSPGEALPRLLGELNYALVPSTNSASKLLVFRTTVERATQRVLPSLQVAASTGPKRIPNELIVRLKPGAKIEDIARLLGAKVIGRIDGLNAYRLQFDNEAAADAARSQLVTNPQVSSVDSNYSIDRPPAPGGLNAAGGLPPPPSLELKPPPDSGRLIVGLVDTAVQPLGKDMDQFLMKQISVAGDAELDPNAPSHGTSMAETILRSVSAVTKGSSSIEILPVDVYGPNASTSTFDVANGIAQAVNGGAKVVNLSLGSEGDSPFLHSVIQQANSLGVVFIGAAGNQPVTTPFYPAAYTEVTAVTALDQGQLAPYANRGSFVSVGEPGTSVVYYNSQPWYVVGTSPAAAAASGVVIGVMDATGASAQKARSVLLNNFGFHP